MNRRGFLGFLASLPFIGKLAPEEWTFAYAMPTDCVKVKRVFSEGEIPYQCPGVIEFPGRVISGLCSTPGHLFVTFEDGSTVELTGDSPFNFQIKGLR